MKKNTAMAVTGDVGAGKSTVAGLFEALGGVRIDADLVVGELWRTKEVADTAVGRWGGGILDRSGRVMHKAVAGIIFENRAEYDWATSLLHPRVRKEIQRRVDLLGNEQWAVVEIPLLFESGVADWVTATIFVAASRETRLERCRVRGWDEAEMTRRESFFLPSEERMALSDYVVQNDGDFEALKKQVNKIHDAAVK